MIQTEDELKSEVRDDMRVEWDVPIEMDDGLVLRADVFRPTKEKRYPVLLSYGPYAKGLAFQDGYPSAWQRMVEQHPDVSADRAISTKTGKLSIRKSGCRTTTFACASIRAVAAARQVTLIIFRRERRRISTTALNGLARRRGQTAKSDLPAFPTTASINGTWLACNRRISPQCASGKAPLTGTAT